MHLASNNAGRVQAVAVLSRNEKSPFLKKRVYFEETRNSPDQPLCDVKVQWYFLFFCSLLNMIKCMSIRVSGKLKCIAFTGGFKHTANYIVFLFFFNKMNFKTAPTCYLFQMLPSLSLAQRSPTFLNHRAASWVSSHTTDGQFATLF